MIFPHAMQSWTDNPPRYALIKPALKQSPAPVVSNALTGIPGDFSNMDRSYAIDPLHPSFITTRGQNSDSFFAAISRSSNPVRVLDSFAFGINTLALLIDRVTLLEAMDASLAQLPSITIRIFFTFNKWNCSIILLSLNQSWNK